MDPRAGHRQAQVRRALPRQHGHHIPPRAPEGSTRATAAMPVSATQYALHILPLVSPLCISTTLTQCANAMTAGKAGGTRSPSVCALQVYGGGKYWHRSAQASWRRDDRGGARRRRRRRRGRGRNGQTRQTDEYAPSTLRTEPGARSQLRLLTTTERPSSRRWEEGEAAMLQYGSG